MLNKLNVKRYINDETGVSLLIAVMTLLVLSIIGVTLATVTFANVKLTTTDREYQSAYYIAEAGVNETYAEIKELILDSYDNTTNESDFYSAIEPVLLEDISDSTLTNFERSLGEQPEAQITITKIDDGNPRTYQISSEGKIGQRERTVTKEFVVNWTPKGGGSPMPNIPVGTAAMVKSKLNLSTEIIGDVYIASGDSSSVEMNWGGKITSGNLYAPENRNSDMIITPDYFSDRPIPQSFDETIDFSVFENIVNNIPEPPIGIPLISSIDLGGGIDMTREITESTYIQEIRIESDRTLNIDTQGETIDLVVDNFLLNQGHINILGGGKLNIYVKDQINFGGDPTMNLGGDIGQLNIFYSGHDSVTVGGAVRVTGSFFNKYADLTFTAGHGDEPAFSGYIVSRANKIKIEGGPSLKGIFIAPYATMNISGGINIDGIIIVDQLKTSGGGIIKFENLSLPEFPLGNGNGESEGDLLIPFPNVE